MTAPAVQARTRYLTVQELADYFGVSKSTIYRAYKEWPHSELGGIRFSEEDVAEIELLIHKDGQPSEPEPKYSAKQLTRAAERLGLPAPRRGS